jgi:hypothetical protein
VELGFRQFEIFLGIRHADPAGIPEGRIAVDQDDNPLRPGPVLDFRLHPAVNEGDGDSRRVAFPDVNISRRSGRIHAKLICHEGPVPERLASAENGLHFLEGHALDDLVVVGLGQLALAHVSSGYMHLRKRRAG